MRKSKKAAFVIPVFLHLSKGGRNKQCSAKGGVTLRWIEKMDWANDHQHCHSSLIDVKIMILPSLTSTIFGECSLSIMGA